MNQDGPEKETDKAAEQRSDDSLRGVLSSYRVPEPSRDFVSDLMLRIQLHQHPVVEPSEDFVDRVMEAWSREHSSSPAEEPASETLVPVLDLSRHAPAEETELRTASRIPMALALVGFAAALILAFFIGQQSATPTSFTDQALVRIDEFPARGSNRFARSLSLVVDRVDSRLLARQSSEARSHGPAASRPGPAYPRPILSLPAPPSNLIPSAVVQIHADKATLESLGIAQENL